MSDIDLDAVVRDQQERPHQFGPGAVEDLRDRLAAEVRQLREVREEWRRLYSNAVAERDELRAAVERVRHILSSGYADFSSFQADLREAVGMDPS